MSGMKVKELMDSLKGDCYRFRVHYPEEWEFGLITGATFFGKRGLVLQHGEDDVSSFTLNPSWLSCEDETQRCIMVVRMGAGSKPLRPWQVCAGDVIGSGKRVEYVFERYGELYISASDEELVRQGKRTYGEELTRLCDLDLSGWRVIGHYGCGRGYEGRSWYDMGKPFGRR